MLMASDHKAFSKNTNGQAHVLKFVFIWIMSLSELNVTEADFY